MLPPSAPDQVRDAAAPGAGAPSSGRGGRLIRRCLSLLGLMSLCYLAGAAVSYFNLPTSSFLHRAFQGGMAWYEVKQASPGADAPRLAMSVGRIDKPGKTCDGFTLCMFGTDSRAVLLNMRGDVVHEWHVPFSRLWPQPTHLGGRVDDAQVYFNDGHLFPNGDLLVVVEGPIDLANPSNGCGLARLDRDSNVLWKYGQKCHHDVDVGEDGTVYALTNEVLKEAPRGLEYLPTPCLIDLVDVISPEGKGVKRIPVLEAFRDSPYAALLCPLEKAAQDGGTATQGMSPFMAERQRLDVLHMNSVKVLSRALAPKFPLFKAGQLLIGPRNLDVIAVLDPDSGRVTWAARGPWRAQHDPSFLDNGHLLLFDNLGSPRGSRVLEYDPQTQSFPWSYPDPARQEPAFLSRIRGMSQRLPNGNTLIVNSDGGEVFEVTADHEVVWTCSTPSKLELNRARRFTPDQVPFLKGDQRARP
jgi:hypothetical protein